MNKFICVFYGAEVLADCEIKDETVRQYVIHALQMEVDCQELCGS